MRDTWLNLTDRLFEYHAKLQKNQDRRLQRKNAAIVKEGGAPIVLDRALKADTSVSVHAVSFV